MDRNEPQRPDPERRSAGAASLLQRILGRGPFYGYVAWTGAWLGYTMIAGGTGYLLQVLFDPWLEEITPSRAAIATTFTVFALTLGAGTPLAAWFIQRFGARSAILLGGLIASSGLALSSLFAQNIITLYILYGGLIGLGQAIGGPLACQTVINNWFVKRRGLMLGVGLTGGGIGGFVSLPAVQFLMEATGNWRTAVLIWAAVVATGCLISFLLVRGKPEDMGQYPDGLSREEHEARRRDSLAAQEGSQVTRQRVWRSPWDFTLPEAIRTRAFWIVSVGIFLAFIPTQFIISQHVVYMTRDLGVEALRAATIAGALLGFSIGGRIAVGLLADLADIRYVWLLTISTVVVGVALLWQAGAALGLMLALYALIYGFGHGAIIILQPITIANYFGVRHYAAIMGVVFPVLIVLSASGAPLAGLIFDTRGSYDLVFISALVFAILGAALLLFASPPRKARPPASPAQG